MCMCTYTGTCVFVRAVASLKMTHMLSNTVNIASFIQVESQNVHTAFCTIMIEIIHAYIYGIRFKTSQLVNHSMCTCRTMYKSQYNTHLYTLGGSSYERPCSPFPAFSNR